MRFYRLQCRFVWNLRQIYSVEICRTISWLLAIDVSTLSAISGYCHRRKSSALGSQSASCTFVLIFALCLFAGFKRAYVFCYAKALRTLPASRFCTNIFVFQHVLCHKVLIYLNCYPVQFCAIKCKNKLSFSLICVEMSLRLRCVSRCEVPVSPCPPRRWRGQGARRAGHETLRCRRFKSVI